MYLALLRCVTGAGRTGAATALGGIGEGIGSGSGTFSRTGSGACVGVGSSTGAGGSGSTFASVGGQDSANCFAGGSSSQEGA